MSFLRRALRPPRFPQGRYTYRGTGDFAGMALQLRVEPDGRGVMVIKANTVLHLNETATVYAYHFMQGKPENDVLKQIRRLYRVDPAKAKADYEKLIYTVRRFVQYLFLKWKKKNPSHINILRRYAWI
jgi:hypothetical protein